MPALPGTQKKRACTPSGPPLCHFTVPKGCSEIQSRALCYCGSWAIRSRTVASIWFARKNERYLNRFLLSIHLGCHAAGIGSKVNLSAVRRSRRPVAALPAGRSAGVDHSSVFILGFVQPLPHGAGYIAFIFSSHKGSNFSLRM